MPLLIENVRPRRPGAAVRHLWIAAWLSLFALPAAVAGADGDLPQQLLRDRFQLRLSGQVWEQAEEPLLQRRLRELPELRLTILSARRRLDTLAAENRQLWRQVERQAAALRTQLATLPTGDSERRKIEKRLRQLRQQATAPADLCGRGDAGLRLRRLIDLELAAALRTLWAQRVLESLPQRHQRLSRRPEVTSALHKLGQQLSSPERYRDAGAVLDDMRKLVLTDVTPLYRQGDQLRFGMLLNDRCPATFTWDEHGQHHLVPFALCRGGGAAAGLPTRPAAAAGGGQGAPTDWSTPVVIPRKCEIGRHVRRTTWQGLAPARLGRSGPGRQPGRLRPAAVERASSAGASMRVRITPR